MSEYFDSREAAETFLIEAKTYKATFFARIINHGTEKWMVSYHSKRDILASPHIEVLEDHSAEIPRITNSVWPDREREVRQAKEREEVRARELQEREEARRNERQKQEERIAAIKAAREVKGSCSMCGKPLGLFAKLMGRVQHGSCSQFREDASAVSILASGPVPSLERTEPEPTVPSTASRAGVAVVSVVVRADAGATAPVAPASPAKTQRADQPRLDDPELRQAIQSLTSYISLSPGFHAVKGAGSEGEVMVAVEQFKRLHERYSGCYELHYAYAAALQVAAQGKSAEDVLTKCVKGHPGEWLARETLKQKALYSWNPFFQPEFSSAEGAKVHPLINDFVKTVVLVPTRKQLVPRAVLFLRDGANELPTTKLRACKMEFMTTISQVTNPQVIAINCRIYDDPNNPFQCEEVGCPLRPFGSAKRLAFELLARQDTFEFVVLDEAGIVKHVRRITPSARMQAVHARLARILETNEAPDPSMSDVVAAIRRHQSILDPRQILY
jgi:hypothetical protein